MSFISVHGCLIHILFLGYPKCTTQIQLQVGQSPPTPYTLNPLCLLPTHFFPQDILDICECFVMSYYAEYIGSFSIVW